MAGRDRGKRVASEDESRPSGRRPRSGRRLGDRVDESRMTPDTAISSMSEGELDAIRARFGVPDAFTFHVPDVGGRASNPPEGQITVYEEYMRAGLRFPLIGFVRGLFNYYTLSFGQLVPNSIRTIMGFFLVCFLAGVRPRMGLFRPLFVLRRHSRARGWWILNSREGRFLPDLPSSIHGWKNRFFYVSCSEGAWGCPTVWSEPRTSPNKNAAVDSVDERDFRTLLAIEVPALKELINDVTLSEASARRPPSDMFSSERISSMFRRPPGEGEAEQGGSRKKKRKRTTAGPSSASQEAGPEPVGAEPAPRGASVERARPEGQTDRPAAARRAPTAAAERPGRTRTPSRSESVEWTPSGSDGGRPRRPPVIQRGEGSRQAAGSGEGDSAPSDLDAVRRLVGRLVQPRDVETLSAWTAGDVLPAAFESIVKAAHYWLVVDKEFTRFQELADSWLADVRTARAECRAARAEGQTALERLQVSEGQRGRLSEDLARAKKDRDSARASLEKEREDSNSLRTRLRQAESSFQAMQAERETDRAAVAAAEAEADASKAETRAAKAIAEQAQSDATQAVAVFRASEGYMNEVAEASKSFYLTGFADCRKVFGRMFPGLDVSRVGDPLVAEGSSEEEEEEEEPEPVGECSRAAPEYVSVSSPEPVEATGAVVLEVPDDEPLVDALVEELFAHVPVGVPTDQPPIEAPTEEQAPEGPSAQTQLQTTEGLPAETPAEGQPSGAEVEEPGRAAGENVEESGQTVGV